MYKTVGVDGIVPDDIIGQGYIALLTEYTGNRRGSWCIEVYIFDGITGNRGV